MAWLSGYSYRKSITLSRASGAVTNYQMKLLVGESAGATGEDVDCNSHVQTDFDDLRFTAADGTTLLDYWIESISADDSPNKLATVWIEFDSIEIGATTFYMYYGKADATAVSSGANTFIVFDDFERGLDGDAIGGSWTQDTGTTKISTAQKYGGTRAGIWTGDGTNYPRAHIPVTASANIAIRFRMRKEGAIKTTWINHADNTNGCLISFNSDKNILVYNGVAYVDTTLNWVYDTWALYEINNFDWTALTCSLSQDGNAINSIDISYAQSDATINNQFKVTGDSTNNYDMWIDDFIVRNFRSTGPAWGSWGSEDEEPTEAIVIAASPIEISIVVSGDSSCTFVIIASPIETSISVFGDSSCTIVESDVGWKRCKDSGPWTFNKGKWPTMEDPWKVQHVDRISYNEGDHIAYAPTIPGGSSIWSMEEGSNVPITSTHDPCGYWTKGYVPNDPYSHVHVYGVQGWPSAAGAGQETKLVKLKMSDLSLVDEVTLGDYTASGIGNMPGIKYVPSLTEGEDSLIIMSADISLGGADPDWRIQKRKASDLSLIYSFIYDPGLPTNYSGRTWSHILLSGDGIHFYCWLTEEGRISTVFQKRNISDGSLVWSRVFGAYPGIHQYKGVCLYDGNIYAIGENYYKRLYLCKFTEGNVHVWEYLDVADAEYYYGAGIFVDATGIYIAYYKGTTDYWIVQKWTDETVPTLEWTQSPGVNRIPYKIIDDGTGANIIIVGGSGSARYEKRAKADGSLLCTGGWQVSSTNYALDLTPVSNGIFYVGGDDFGGAGATYRARYEKVNSVDLTTIAYVTDEDRKVTSGITTGL